MRPTPVTVTVAQSPVIFMTDYFQGNISIQAVPIGGSTYTVNYTADDPNDTTITPTWFAITGMTAATTAQWAAISQQPIRALQYNVSVAGSVRFIVLQGSGTDGIGIGQDY